MPSESSGPDWDLLVDSLTELARHGEHVGALLAAETGSESGADLKQLVESIPGQLVAVDLNPAKLILNGFSPREAAEQLGIHIAHVHASDGVRDLTRGRGIEVALGRGSAEFPELLGVLENSTYRGFITVERQASDDPERDVSLAVMYLQNL